MSGELEQKQYANESENANVELFFKTITYFKTMGPVVSAITARFLKGSDSNNWCEDSDYQRYFRCGNYILL